MQSLYENIRLIVKWQRHFEASLQSAQAGQYATFKPH